MEKKNLSFKYMDIIDVDITLRENYTVIDGNSATGKTYLYNILKNYLIENSNTNMICLDTNNTDFESIDNTINKLKKLNNAIIVIDQADDVFDESTQLRDYVERDRNNYYIIMSRKFARQYTELAKIIATKNSISIKYKINLD
jgi:endo-alpha-1,4-polygalactosaminidase (GH114 family)